MKNSIQKPNKAWLNKRIKIPVEDDAVHRVARVLAIVGEAFYTERNIDCHDFWVRTSAQFVVYEAIRQQDDAQWIPIAHTLPPKAKKQDICGYTYSEEVLLTDGKNIYIGRSCEDEDLPGEISWRIYDGYEFEGVTHWCPAPKLSSINS